MTKETTHQRFVVTFEDSPDFPDEMSEVLRTHFCNNEVTEFYSHCAIAALTSKVAGLMASYDGVEFIEHEGETYIPHSWVRKLADNRELNADHAQVYRVLAKIEKTIKECP